MSRLLLIKLLLLGLIMSRLRPVEPFRIRMIFRCVKTRRAFLMMLSSMTFCYYDDPT